MTYFIDICTVLWFGSTALALYHAIVTQDFDTHRHWMARSMCVMRVPLWQRIASIIFLTPMAAFARCAFEVLYIGEAPWEARWGAPGSAWSLFTSAHAAVSSADPRASPLVWSFDGFGEAEQATFAASAWLGLVMSGAVNTYTVAHDVHIKNSTLCDVLRTATRRATSAATEFSVRVGLAAASTGLSAGGVWWVVVAVLAMGAVAMVPWFGFAVGMYLGGLTFGVMVVMGGGMTLYTLLPYHMARGTMAAGYHPVFGIGLAVGWLWAATMLPVLLLGKHFETFFGAIPKYAFGVLLHTVTFGLIFDDPGRESTYLFLSADEKQEED
eukprot:TRINITY_DN55609_c0_g1_i1.p1 TRINITY_DN55609_c0_g1~~TRINITY_DN55609_c0_g1_i1.p1  ORF type:complete len:326 (-),score=69.46 TRINITY_DN55609_c0_g1_i1:262-1239(-)